MTDRELRDLLTSTVLVFDGAMGTEIYRHHVFINRCYEELNVSDPGLVRTIHREYVDAGADVLTTNTFGANHLALAKFGLAERMAELNVAGAKLAREIAQESRRSVLVAGSVGPVSPDPFCPFSMEDILARQVGALVNGGVDFILFETQQSREMLEACARVMGAYPETAFILSMAVGENGETQKGEPIERLAGSWPATLRQPAAWGLNCGTGPSGLLGVLERLLRLTDLPVVVQPNAGVPKQVDYRMIYFCSPEYFTEYAKRYLAVGARGVGGCCGIAPEHIREMAQAIKPLARAAKSTAVLAHAVTETPTKEPTPLEKRSQLGWRIVHKKWITSVELLPPRGWDLRPVIEKSRQLAAAGVTAVNIPDGPRASARLSPLVTAAEIQRQAGIETILHFCCRDRNLIGMQADLLGCAALGVHNILFVTGDPPKLGNYPFATGVFDADSIGMVAVQRRLNTGIDLGGQPVEPPTQAVIGVGLDPTAVDRNRERERFRRKIAAGAEFAITQPVFDPDALLRFLDELGECPIPIVAGIWPLASLRNALFLKNEVPGVVIPDRVLERLAAQTTREGQLAVGIEVARESVERIKDCVAGIQVSAPFGKIELALQVLEGHLDK
ncbi:MAG: bifunctional homocysteine S-methyltransferase/methylenetetrahydrofolate reductase [Thermoguttaceae bacterium]|nr:bifunctional homocysteine S-methyltransferase/methylenetetrahydrofolate reductase [Thermoguttaceae bacterium]MDW8078700.1 bifunctional homocysteine S-methyltransferase/methylenetetrahydrofolate reductase [Thermoguttaceae bacterium]